MLLIHHTWLSSKDNSAAACNLKSALPRTELQEMDYFGDFTQHVSNYVPRERNADLLEYEFQHHTKFYGPCVGTKENDNLTGS